MTLLSLMLINKEEKRTRRTEEEKGKKETDLLTVIFCELGEESASLLGLEVSQHRGDDGANVF